MAAKWTVLVLMVKLTSSWSFAFAPCTSVDYLHLGCFKEKPSDREFLVSAGNYNSSNLTPRLCVQLCGHLSYKFSALQNGNFCLCGKTYGKYGTARTCDLVCTGDLKTTCGGQLANNVYNSTPFIGIFSLPGSSEPFLLFQQASVEVRFTNGTVSDPGVSIYTGEENGFSGFQSIQNKYNYYPTKWGSRTLKAKISVGNSLRIIRRRVQIASPVKHLELKCPEFVETGKQVICQVSVYQGTNMNATWKLESGHSVHRPLPDPGFLGVGSAVPQWTVMNLESNNSSGVFLMLSSVFIQDSRVLALETYGHTAGSVTIFVARPVCTLESQYCIDNATCIPSSQQCAATKTTRKCNSSEALSLTSSSCQSPASCNNSIPKPRVYQSKQPNANLTIVCVYSSVTIQASYNLYVVPTDNICQARKGDILGWATEGNGRVAHRRADQKVLHFPSLTVMKGLNITNTDTPTEMATGYLVRAVAASPAAFQSEHTLNKAGSHFYHVQVQNNLTSLPVMADQEIRAQQPLTWMSPVYPLEFDYFGTRKGVAVEIVVNISAATNVTVISKNVSSGNFSFSFTKPDIGRGEFFLGKANLTFGNEGCFLYYVLAYNKISTVNVTLNILVAGKITGLSANLSEPTKPVYIGFQTGLLASVAEGDSVYYKWTVSGDDTKFIKNNLTTYSFRKEGMNNVTVVASNLAFTSMTSFIVNAVNPLTLEAPTWYAVNKPVTLNCTLISAFSSPQTYNWSFGDGSSNSGSEKRSVQHTFTKASTYNVTCAIVNDIPIISSRRILILEPVSGRCLNPVVGVEQGTNRTFLAKYTTGNNLTMVWALQGDRESTLAVCTDDSFTYFFDKPGRYNLTLRISNALNSITCSQQFLVEEKISNVSMKIFPNPAPSNTTVRFEITKGNGTNVTYSILFGDDICERNFDGPFFVYNRSFTAKNWQIILIANNSVSSIVVFRKLKVQDVVKNVVVTVDYDGISSGRMYIAVGKLKHLRCVAEQGTELSFVWSINEKEFEDKGDVQKSGKSIVQRNETFRTAGEIKIKATAENLVSNKTYSITLYAQEPIEGFEIKSPQGVTLNSKFNIKFSKTRGDNVSYNVRYDNSSPGVTTQNYYVTKTFSSQKVFLVEIKAFNQVSNVTKRTSIAVQTKIEGFHCRLLKGEAAEEEEVMIFWSITKGSDINFHIDYNDGSSTNLTIASHIPSGGEFNVSHRYKKAGKYRPSITAWNLLPPQVSRSIDLTIEKPIRNLRITNIDNVDVYQTFKTSATVDQGTNVAYWFDFGDGSTPLQSSSGKVEYKYSHPSGYHVKITARNHIGKVEKSTSIKVSEPDKIKPISGLKVVARPTAIGNHTLIRVLSDSGTHYKCKIKGEGLSTTKENQQLSLPIKYLYKHHGEFKVTAVCFNDLGKVAATTEAIVEQPITGLAFSDSSPSWQLKFGELHDVSWSWKSGSNVICTVRVLSSSGSIVRTIKNLDKSVELEPEIFSAPGSYKLKVDANNSVSSENISKDLVLIEPIKDIQLKVNPNVQVNFPAMMFLDMKAGTHTTSVWTYGNTTLVLRSESNNRFIRNKYEFPSAGSYKVTVVVWNRFSTVNQSKSETIAILKPINGFTIEQFHQLDWPSRDVVLKFNYNNLNAQTPKGKYSFDFGDGIRSREFLINSSQVHFSQGHEYAKPGCYDVKLTISNEISRRVFDVKVKIIERIWNITLEAKHSDQSSLPGKPGFVKNQNYFPLEYPVAFEIAYSSGSCIHYDWDFGDKKYISNVTNTIVTHKYPPVPGNYRVQVKAYNTHGNVKKALNIVLKRSVIGLFLVSSSPSRPNEQTQFIVFCAQPGNDSSFVLDTGDQRRIPVPIVTRGTGQQAMRQYISPYVTLPFNVTNYYSAVISHTYKRKGIYKANVKARNQVSNATARTTVVVTDWNCQVPKMELFGGGETPQTAHSLSYGREFTIRSRINISCTEDGVESRFSWSVFKANVYLNKGASKPPEEGRKISLPGSVVTNQSSITIPVLQPGDYILRLTVTLSKVEITNSMQCYVQVKTPSVQADIVGGSARSRGWENEVILNASNSFDPLSTNNKNLTFEWYCQQVKNEILFGQGGCFGRGENLVESVGPVFKIRAKSLLESVTYAFNVTITAPTNGKKRTGSFIQRIEIVPGNPPDINIRCKYNCNKKVTAEEQLALEAYCADCHNDSTTMEYHWSAMTGQSDKEIKLWPSQTLTDQDSKYVVVKGNAFAEDTKYVLKVKANRKGGASAFAEYKFKTNSPPSHGKCAFEKDEVEELKPLFVSCNKWQEEDTPLAYEIIINKTGELTLLWYGPQLSKSKVILEAGKPEHNHTMDLIVRVRDAYGAVADTHHKIKVTPLSDDKITYGNLHTSSSKIETSLANGDVIGAIQLTTAIGSINNERGGNMGSENRAKLRSDLLESMKNVIPRDLQAVRQLTGGLAIVTKNSEELSIDAQMTSVPIYSRAVQVIVEKAAHQGKNSEPAQIELASQIALLAISNALVATGTSSEKLFKNPAASGKDLEKSRQSASKLVGMTNNLAKATLNGKLPGENATTYKTNGITLTVKKIMSGNLGQTTMQVEGENRFSLPSEEVLLGSSSESKAISLAISCMGVNPFSGTNSSQMIRSEATSLVIMDEASKEVQVSGLSDYIDIYLHNKNATKEETNVTLTKSLTNITVHKISNVRSKTAISADIIPVNRSITLDVYVKFNARPSKENYDFKITLPRYDVNETGNVTTPGPYTLFVSSDYVNASGDYYVGVVPLVDNGTISSVEYSFDPFVSGCYYWDNVKGVWTNDGCKVGNKSSFIVTHCQCNHLTWFGGDFFVPPNNLDIIEQFKNIKNLVDSPALIATICIVGGLYILAMVWARRQDKKDLTKVGLIAVPDNDPTDRFRYEVTVYTGRMARSTTSNISIVLYGDLNESHQIALKDDQRPIFESGSVDSFLVTVPVALGPLNYLRIWHDNSGVWPAWYLNQVIIRDIDTDDRFVFLCYRWFACDEDDGQVVRLLPVAGKDELREFTYLFRSRTKKDFSDAHLWFSIALRPPRSIFTRAQRISCCFSLLLCTMLTNAMWYDTTSPNPNRDIVIFQSGFVTITWRQIVIGIQSSLIVFPVNLLIVHIFRNTSRKPKKKRKPEEMKEFELKEKKKHQQILKLNDIQTITRSESSEAILDSNLNKAPKSMSIKRFQGKKFSREDSFEDDLLSLLKETRMLEDSQFEKSVLDMKDLPDKNLESINIGKESLEKPFAKQDVCNLKSVSPASECSFEWTDNSKLVKQEKRPQSPVQIRIPKLKFLFPWWSVYVGWTLCALTALISGLLTILYGNSFEKEKQHQWLISMFISIAQDIFISQPLKVIGFALFFALVWKKSDNQEDTLTAELAKDEEWLKENVKGRRRNALIAQQPKYLPPDEVMLKKARIRRFKERKMVAVIREIVLYAMFVWVVLVIAYGHRDPNSHVMNQGIENMLTGTGNSWLVDYTQKKPKNTTIRKFLKVSGVDKYWAWIKQILLPNLYNGPWYNDQDDTKGFMADRTSWVLATARIRQIRVKIDTCEVYSVFSGFLDNCNNPYSWSSEDTTKHFKPGWQDFSNETSPTEAWTYKTGTDLESLPFMGRMAFYSGGGYALDLGATLEEAKRKTQELESSQWIDKLTRAVFVEINIHNANTNLYCVVFLVLEVSASGGSFPFVELLITRIDRYAGNFMIFVLIFELAFVCFLIFFTYKLVKGAIKNGPRYYFKQYWNWVELGLVTLSWTAVVLYFVRFGINTLTQSKYRKTPNKFINFHHLAASDQLFGHVYAFVVFLVSLKFLRLFRFNRRMSLLASTLQNASKELWCFCLVFGIVFMAFVNFCYLVFSPDLYMFHTVMSTVETLISVMLGKFSYERLLQTNRILAPLMFFTYSVIVVFVLINMFISIIIENFQEVKRNNDLQSNEYEIVDFMMDQFKVWLGWSSWGIIFSKSKVYPAGKPRYVKPKRELQAERLQNRVDRLVNLIQVVYFDREDFLRNDGEVTYQLSSIDEELST